MAYLILLGICLIFNLIAYFLFRYLCGMNRDDAIKLSITVVAIGSIGMLLQLALRGFFNAF